MQDGACFKADSGSISISGDPDAVVVELCTKVQFAAKLAGIGQAQLCFVIIAKPGIAGF